MYIRKPAVAGSFYPLDPGELSSAVDSCYLHPLGPGRRPPERRTESKVVSVVSPHAGYVYSGPVAAHSYLHVSSLPDPDLIVIVAPNHYGIGSGVSTFRSGQWETPLGLMQVDPGAAKSLVEEGVADYDAAASAMEHSLEVQLPFLQRIYGDRVPFLPVTMLFQDPETSRALARGIVKVVGDRRAVLVASSDLTHYEPASVAAEKDRPLLAMIASLDFEGFYSTLEQLQVTACGFGAIATVMAASRALGLVRGEVLKYASSGDTTGDNSQVVGYGAVRFLAR